MDPLPPPPARRAAGVGLVGGFAGGLLGIGGGLLFVPGLVIGLGLQQHRAHAASTTAIVASSLAALASLGPAGKVSWDAAAYLMLGAGIGSLAGTRLLERVSAVWLRRLFAALALVAAARLALG